MWKDSPAILLTPLTTAGFENGKRCNGVQLQILKRLLHGLDVTDMTGEVEDELFPPYQLPDQIEVATISISRRSSRMLKSSKAIVAPTVWMHRIKKSYGRAGSDEANSEIASDEPETAGD